MDRCTYSFYIFDCHHCISNDLLGVNLDCMCIYILYVYICVTLHHDVILSAYFFSEGRICFLLKCYAWQDGQDLPRDFLDRYKKLLGISFGEGKDK